MIAIKDIEMPTCCYSCRFSKFPYDINKNPYCNKDPSCTPYCTIVFRELDLPRFDRPDWCPLIEVKEQELEKKEEYDFLIRCTLMHIDNLISNLEEIRRELETPIPARPEGSE